MANKALASMDKMSDAELARVEEQLAAAKLARRQGQVDELNAKLATIDGQIDSLKAERKAVQSEIRGLTGRSESGTREHGGPVGENGQKSQPALLDALKELAKLKTPFSVEQVREAQLRAGYQSNAKAGSYPGWLQKRMKRLIENEMASKTLRPTMYSVKLTKLRTIKDADEFFKGV